MKIKNLDQLKKGNIIFDQTEWENIGSIGNSDLLFVGISEGLIDDPLVCVLNRDGSNKNSLVAIPLYSLYSHSFQDINIKSNKKLNDLIEKNKNKSDQMFDNLLSNPK